MNRAVEEGARLADAARTLGIALPDDALEQLLGYLDLIGKWNRVYNLTALKTRGEMLDRHLIDSLSIVPLIASPSLLDVGSGAGLPGLPVAIAKPETAVTLLDASAKRTRFMTQVAAELGLDNVAVVHARIEAFRPAQRFPVITSRAFAALPDFIAAGAPLLAPGGRLLAMKGQRHDAELAAIPAGWMSRIVPLDYPGRDGQRHAVILTRPAS